MIFRTFYHFVAATTFSLILSCFSFGRPLRGAGKKSDRPSRSPQRLYGFGIGKRSPQRMYEFGLGKRASFGNFDNYGRNRLEEYIKRRYSFGIGKRSAE